MDIFTGAMMYGGMRQAQNDASDARNSSERVAARLADLEKRTDRLALTCQALWEILRDQTGITEQQVYARMEAIDLRDGRRDGKIGGQVLVCRTCGRHVNSVDKACIYCGTPIVTNAIVH